MNLVIEDKQFPLWIVPRSAVSDLRLQQLREANKMFQIDREPSGELLINIKRTATPLRK